MSRAWAALAPRRPASAVHPGNTRSVGFHLRPRFRQSSASRPNSRWSRASAGPSTTRRGPRRFFRSSLLTAGALLSGTALALPAASADAPSFPARCHAVRRGDGSVQVELTREGARKVQRLRGLNVRVQVRATAGGKTTTTTKTVRILPTKVLVVPTDGLFAFDSAKPSAAGVRLASSIASQLFGAREITIVGHADSKGTDAVNERLGLQRARAFAALLRGEGLGGTKVVVRSAGESSPRASNDTARGQQLNRRVEVTVRCQRRP